jgi:ketosteroid isomerase-like protein
MSIEENKETVRRAFEALMAGDLAPIRDLLAPDAVLHQCGFLQPIPAQAILRGEFPGQGRLRDRMVQLERMIGEGDIVAMHWRTSGTYADAESPQRDGVPVSFPSMTFVRLADGRIAEIWNIQDRSTLQSQLDEAAQPVGSGR